MISDYSEDLLIEQPAIELLRSLGWDYKNLFHETFGENGTEKRNSRREVILTHRLRSSILKLNSLLPREAIVICVDDLCHSGSGCIHGDGEILCPYCKGRGKLEPNEE